MSHQYPAARSASVNGSGNLAHQRSGEHPDHTRGQGVTDTLQCGGVLGGGEPVVQLRESEPLRPRFTLGIFMAIDPDFDRVGEIRAHFDERRPEHLIHHIEIVGSHPTVGLGVTKPRNPTTTLITVVGGASEHPLKLLRHPDRSHPSPSLSGQPVQVRAHHLQLAIPLSEAHHRDLTLGSELSDRLTKPQPDPLQDRRRRNRKPQMPGQETNHLPRHLQSRHPTIEVDPIEALQIQTDMPLKDIIHSHDTRCHGAPPGRWQLNPATLPSPSRHVTHQPNHHLGGPRRSLFRWGRRANAARFQDGVEVDDTQVRGVVNRLGGFSVPPAGVSSGDGEYAACERNALLLSWLVSLRCPVLNRPSPIGGVGGYRSLDGWRYLAQRTGLRILPLIQSSDVPEPTGDGWGGDAGWQRTVFAVAGRMVVGDDEGWDEATKEGCARLSWLVGDAVLAVQFVCLPGRAPLFYSATQQGDLRLGRFLAARSPCG
jgi:hypothetical protein